MDLRDEHACLATAVSGLSVEHCIGFLDEIERVIAPDLAFHRTPKHASWLDQVEAFVFILTRKLLERGEFSSPTTDYLESGNHPPHPVRVEGVAVVTGDELVVANWSFDAFYRAEYAAVVRLAFTLSGRRDLAEEHAQDAFLAAHRHWERISRYDDPGAWVRRVVVNRCLSAARRRLNEARLLARLVRLGREAQVVPDVVTAGEDLWGVVRSLPKRQAQVLALTFLEDRSVPDIAQVLGCDEGTVRTHLLRGRRAVASRLKEELDG